MKKITYAPIIKMAEAEFRGIANLSDEIKDKITPLFELTRSRKSKKLKEGDIYRRLNKLKEVFPDRQFFLDLTDDLNLSNSQIRSLHSNDAGYKNWTDFIISLKDTFTSVIPVIQISDENIDTAEEHYGRIKKQINTLNKHFDNVVYRFRLNYKFIEDDLKVICEEINSNKIICIVDVEYIPQNKAIIYKDKVVNVINILKKFSPRLIVLSATSFPMNPTEHGEEKKGTMRLEEYTLYREVSASFKGTNLVYSDYATLHPTRSDQAGGKGWVPRIDMPTKEELFYRRSRKRDTEYTYVAAYIRVARLVTAEKQYSDIKKVIGRCWGINQIDSAASGSPQGLSPSFWISVRMNIHIMNRIIL